MSDQPQQPYPPRPPYPQDHPQPGVPGQQHGYLPAPTTAPVPPGAVPGGPMAGPPPVGAQMKTRNVFAVWLGLPLITFGIYSLVWYYKIHREMKDFDPRAPISPVGSLLTIMFGWVLLGIPPLISFYNTGTRIANAQRAAGLPQTCTPILGLILAIFFGVGTLYYQAELNKIVTYYQNVPTGTPVQLAA